MNTYNLEKNNCEKTELLIDDSLDGMISLIDKELIEEHIAGCTKCSEYYSATSALTKNLKTLPSEVSGLSVQKKNEMWGNIESNIDNSKYENEKAKRDKYDADENKISFFSHYKYFISGIAAVLLIGFIAEHGEHQLLHFAKD